MSLKARSDASEPGASELLLEKHCGKLVECLDDGFVRLVDHMGDDAAIVQAARVSYGAGTKAVSNDRSLIRYLMRNHHTSPFEMVEFKFHVRVPMDCWRQWIRHRTASVNETSTRYSIAIDSCSKTHSDRWRSQSTDSKQGSGAFLPACAPPPLPASYGELTGGFLTQREQELQNLAHEVYEERIHAGVAREQARKDLPLSTYTEAYWKIDGHNLFHFLELRMDAHAQLEIRTYANAIAKLIKPIIPLAWEAFEDYCLNSMTLSGPEIAFIHSKLVAIGDKCPFGVREWKELTEKLKRLGMRAD